MPRKASTNPTEVELEILRVLWSRGPSTVRQVHNTLCEHRETGYSTTLKMMQVMTEKGLLLKDSDQRPQVYRPAISESQTQEHFVDDLIQRVFDGAANKLIMRAVKNRHISSSELEEIKKLIQQIERDSQ